LWVPINCKQILLAQISVRNVGRRPVEEKDGPASNGTARTIRVNACRQNRYRCICYRRHTARRMPGRRCNGGRSRFSKFLSKKRDQYQNSSPGNLSTRRSTVNVAFGAINERFSCLLLLVRFPGEEFSLIPISWRGKAKVQTLVESILERKSQLGSSGSNFPPEEKFFLSGK